MTFSKKLFSPDNKITRKSHYSNFLPSTLFHVYLEELLQQSSISHTCTINTIQYKIYGQKVDNDMLVLILYDLSVKEKVDRIQKRFIANASHELKTPLTAIKGYIDLLQQEQQEEKKTEYIKIIDRNTNRIIAITERLLKLAS